MAEISRQTLIQHYTQFQHPDTVKELRKACDDWLQEARRHPSAWQVFLEVLQNEPPNDPHMSPVRTFAAQSLKWRVVNEQPTGEQAKQLRTALVAALVAYSNGPRGVRLQLCVAIVKLVANDDNPSPETFREVITQLSGRQETVSPLCDFVRIFGEESSSRLRDRGDDDSPKDGDVKKKHRAVILAEAVAGDVMHLLFQIWNMASTDDLKIGVMSAYAQWIRFLPKVQVDQLVGTPLTAAAITGLGDVALKVDGAEVLSELAEASSGSAGAAACPRTVQLVVSQLPVLWGHMQEAMRIQDEDDARVFCRAISHICRSYAELIAHGGPDAARMIGILVQATRHPERDVAETTFIFWHRLSDLLQPSRLHDQQHQQLLQGFGNELLGLVDALILLARVPADLNPEGGTKEEEKDLRKWRKYFFRDAVESCCVCLRTQAVAPRAFALLGEACAAKDWRATEAVLVFLRFTQQFDEQINDQYLPQLFSSFSAFPDQWRVRSSFAHLVGKFAGWLDKKGGALLPQLSSYVSMCCRDEKSAPQAVQAMRDLCQECGRHMLSHLETLVGFCEVTHSLNMDLEDQEEILIGLGSLVCELPDEQHRQAVQVLWSPALQRISGGNRKVVERELQRLCAIARGGAEGADAKHDDATKLRLQRLWANDFKDLWPILLSIMQTLMDNEVMEQLTSLLRQLLKLCGTEFRPYLENVATILVAAYQQCPLSCVLWVSATIVGVFGNDVVCQQPLVTFITHLSECTLRFLSSHPVAPHSDFIEELFYLHDRAICKMLGPVLRGPHFPQVFNMGVAALVNTDVKETAVRLVLEFFEVLFNEGNIWKDPENDRLIVLHFVHEASRGQIFVQAVLQAAVDRILARSDQAATCLYRMKTIGCTQLGEWINCGLSSLPPEVPVAARAQCARALADSVECKQFQDALEDLHNSVPKNWR
eukprot:Hpha_TRINITY_DN12783_c0_g1::TRINITY_DN12783_c0_g1_i1::g.114461::m.114461/K15436/TRPO3, MTR10; transportin-3